jgi:serine/threonine protein kinase
MESLAQSPRGTLDVGAQIGDYVVEHLLGQGTEGAVYRARDVILGRYVALKTVREGSAAHTRCVEEARLMARIDHPSVIRVFHVRRHQRIWYVALEFAGRGSLQARIKALGALPPRETLLLTAQAIEGLGHVHRSGIIHRDVKPQNMLITADGKLKLSDFGLALETRSGGNLRAPGMVGTPAFLAPERWEDAAVEASGDVYSLGVSVFFMLTGHLPFAGNDVSNLKHSHFKAEPRFPDTIPRGVRELVAAMMAKTPSDRPRLDTLLLAEVQRLTLNPESAFDYRSEQPLSPSVFTRTGLWHRSSKVSRVLSQLRDECSSTLNQKRHCAITADDDVVLHRFWEETSRAITAQHPSLARITLETEHVGLATSLRERAGAQAPATLRQVLAVLKDRTGPSKTGIIELRPRAGLGALQRRELDDLIVAASEAEVRVVCFVTGTAATEYTRTLGLRLISLPTSGVSLRALMRAWTHDVTGGQMIVSADGLRVLASETASKQLPWVKVLEQSIAIAAASGSRIVPSWAVWRSQQSTTPATDVLDVPAAMSQRPSSWPPPEVLKRLRELRVSERESLGITNLTGQVEPRNCVRVN